VAAIQNFTDKAKIESGRCSGSSCSCCCFRFSFNCNWSVNVQV